MFEGEVQTAGIHMEFVLSDSYKELEVDWVKLDPSRVLQVRLHVQGLTTCLQRGTGSHKFNNQRYQIHHNRIESHDQSHSIRVAGATIDQFRTTCQFLSVQIQAGRANVGARLGRWR